LDQGRIIIFVVLRVNVLVYNMVAKFRHLIEATRCGVALEVWRPHVGRNPTKEISECHLIVDHLRSSDSAVDLVEIAMSPSMAGNVMTCREHASHHSGPWVGRVIDMSLGPVVARHKESGLGVSFIQKIQEVIGVIERAII
jgi:hypothetical protein